MKKYLTPEAIKNQSSLVESPVTTVAGGPARPLLDLQQAARAKRNDHMTVLVMELFVPTRRSMLPDPFMDPIQGVFYCVSR